MRSQNMPLCPTHAQFTLQLILTADKGERRERLVFLLNKWLKWLIGYHCRFIFFIQIINLSFQVKSHVISSVGFCWPALNERQSWCSLNQRQRWFLNFSQHAVPHTFSNDFLWKMKMRPMSDTMRISSDTWCMEFGWLLSISLRALLLRVFVTWGRMSSQPHWASEAAWSQLMAFTQHSPACQQDLDTEHRKISLFHTHTAVKCHEVEQFNVFIPCSHPVFTPNSTLCSQSSAFICSHVAQPSELSWGFALCLHTVIDQHALTSALLQVTAAGRAAKSQSNIRAATDEYFHYFESAE